MSNDSHTDTCPDEAIAHTGTSKAECIKSCLVDPRTSEVSDWLKDYSTYLPQAGGHQIMAQSNDTSVIYKPTNDTEKDFYERLPHDPSLKELSPFLPEYYGSTSRWKTPIGEWMHASPTQKTSKTDNLNQQIILENLYKDFSNPSIFDFKMGDSLADPDSEAGIIQRSKARIKPLKSTLAPVRLAGCELYTYNSDGSATLRIKLGKKHRILFTSNGENGGYSLDAALALILPGPMGPLDNHQKKNRLLDSLLRSKNFESSNLGGTQSVMSDLPDTAGKSVKDLLHSSDGLNQVLKEYDRAIAVLTSIHSQSSRLKTALSRTEWRFPGASACTGFGPLTAEKLESFAQSKGSDPNIDVIDDDWGVKVSFIDTAYAYPTPEQGGDPGLDKAFDEKLDGLQRRIDQMKEEKQVTELLWKATAGSCSREKSMGPSMSCSWQSLSDSQDDSFRSRGSEVTNVLA